MTVIGRVLLLLQPKSLRRGAYIRTFARSKKLPHCLPGGVHVAARQGDPSLLRNYYESTNVARWELPLTINTIWSTPNLIFNLPDKAKLSLFLKKISVHRMRNFFPTELIFLFPSFFLSKCVFRKAKASYPIPMEKTWSTFFFLSFFFRATSNADYTGCCDIKLGWNIKHADLKNRAMLDWFSPNWSLRVSDV